MEINMTKPPKSLSADSFYEPEIRPASDYSIMPVSTDTPVDTKATALFVWTSGFFLLIMAASLAVAAGFI